jgi:hypothetical protein
MYWALGINNMTARHEQTLSLALTGVVPAVCDAEAACSLHSRATIMAELAAVLRDSDATITNIESAIFRAGVQMEDISATFGGTRELLLAMASQLSESMLASLTIDSTHPDFRQRLPGVCIAGETKRP